VLVALDHPYIVKLIDRGALTGRAALHRHGVHRRRTDRCLLRASPRLDQCEDRARLLIKVMEALSHSHRHLIIHSDLKPPNIMVTSGGAPKLLGFWHRAALPGARWADRLYAAVRKSRAESGRRGHSRPPATSTRSVSSRKDLLGGAGPRFGPRGHSPGRDPAPTPTSATPASTPSGPICSAFSTVATSAPRPANRSSYGHR
jgi:serine/threonine protein kinase